MEDDVIVTVPNWTDVIIRLNAVHIHSDVQVAFHRIFKLHLLFLWFDALKKWQIFPLFFFFTAH